MFEFLLGVFLLGEDTGSPGRRSIRLGEDGVRLGEGVRLGVKTYA